jgi:hypothetical protein
MKKILALILIIGTLAFSKESVSYTHAYVTHSEAIYEYRNNRVYDDYYEEDDYYRSDYNQYSQTNTNNIGLDTIVGGTIGVIIGNQIGKGNGRTAAKIVGGLLGASVANHNRYEANNYVKHPNKKRHYRNQREKVLVGYRNYFVFENRQYSKVTNRAKKRIKIRKTINF